MKYIIFLLMSLLTLILFLSPFLTFGQNTNATIEQMIKKDLDSSRKISGILNSSDYHFNDSNERYFLNFIRQYENDSSGNIQLWVQDFKMGIAYQSNNTLLRQEVVQDFTTKISDGVLDWLVNFKQTDFSTMAKNNMVRQFNNDSLNGKLIMVCGIAQIQELLPKLRRMAARFSKEDDDIHQPRWWQTAGWYAALATARMDGNADVDNIIAAVELELEPFFRVTNLLRYAAYTRHKYCVRLIQKYLASTEKLPGMDGRPGIDFSQYAIDLLAGFVDSFPVKQTGVGTYNKDQIDMAREFLSTQRK